MGTLVLVAATVIGILLDIPVVFAMGVGCVLAIVVTPGVNLLAVPNAIFSSLDSFVLLAIPLFVLGGELMNGGGMSNRLAELSRRLVGHFRGGLGQVAIVSTMFFSGMIGSKVAETYALGSVLFPIMAQEGYPVGYAAALISAASAMGELIPPAILMVVLGVLMDLSVARLFVAGLLPAVVFAIMLAVLVYFDAQRLGLDRAQRPSLRQLLTTLRRAFWPLLLPVVIFGGVLLGIATPTEVAGVAAVYALILGFIYRGLGRRNLWELMVRTVATSGSILLLIGVASVFSYVLALQRVPQMLAGAILSVSAAPLFFLMISNLLFVAAGALLEGLPAVTILVPVLLPVARQLHIDPLHYAILITAAVGIGLYLPPLGIGAIVSSQAANTTMRAQMRYTLPFNLVLVVGLIILTVFPAVVTWLPGLLMH